MMQTGQMVKIAAQHPAKALVYINKALNELACLTKDPAVQAFDMDIDDSCVEVAILHCCVQPMLNLPQHDSLADVPSCAVFLRAVLTILLLPWVRPAPCMRL